jgi:uncharacterized membrane protein
MNWLRPTMSGGAYVNTVIRRPRLLIGVAVGLFAYLVAPWQMREATRALIGWNAGAWAFIALVSQMMLSGGAVTEHAAQEDEKPAALLTIAVVAAIMAVAAIVWELGPVKDMKGANKALHLGLVGLTILSSWAFIHLMFALHYAAQYYATAGDDVRGGFLFPDCEAPGWTEFCYESFTIGCACATADVNLTTRGARSVCLIQSIIAFFFNTIILALTINIGAGLF